MAGEIAGYIQGKESRRRSMAEIPGAALNPILQQLAALTLQKERKMDRLSAAALLKDRIDAERNIRDAAIRVKTQEAQDATLSYQAGRDKTPPEAFIAKLGDPGRFNTNEYQRGLNEAQQIEGVNEEKSAYADVSALDTLDKVQGYKADTPAKAKARGLRMGELVDAGVLKDKQDKEAKVADVSKSIAAAASPEELDRIDTLGDSPLNTALNRKRKVLTETQDRTIGEALAGYKGGPEGIADVFKEKGIKPTPGDLARAEEIVFKRKAYDRAEDTIKRAEEATKAGKAGEARQAWTSASNALNAQIDDIEKKAIVRDLLTNTATFNADLLSSEDKTLLTRLKSARLKAVDALSTIASGDPSALISGMDPAQKRALLESLVKEGEAKK